MSDAKNDVLARVKGWFEQAMRHPAYAGWRAEARMAWDFYDGNQWTQEEIDRLAENGQPAIVINRIASKVDNLAGTEVAGRTRMIYRSRSGAASEEKAAQMMTDVGLFVAEQSNQALEVSRVFRSGLVCGLGWLDVGVQDGLASIEIFSRAEDEMSVVWDPLSRRHDFADMRFVARERWLDETEIRSLFSEQADALLANLKQSTALGQVVFGGVRDDVAYVDPQRDVYRIVEVQYKELARQWRMRLPDGRLVVSFEKAQALAMPDAVIEEVVKVPRVMVALFSGDVLLDNRPLAYDHNNFTLIPYVYKRARSDGRPYGMVRAALDPQRELNKRRSKAMHLLNTSQVIADVDAVEDPNILAREAARPDGVILKRAGKDLRIIRNIDLATTQVSVMEQAGRDIQEVLGVFDETLGKDSNATSAVAIQQRQLAGSMNQMFAFDALRFLKKNLGMHIMELVRQFFSTEMLLMITDQLDASRTLKLGQPLRDAEGRVNDRHLRVADLRGLSFDVVVEEVKDVLSQRELEARQLNMLLAAGVPVPPQVLVEASGVRHKEVILAALETPKS